MSDYPEGWDFDRDGLTCSGLFLKIKVVTTNYGPTPLLSLHVDGEERTIWLSTVLKNQMAEELTARGATNFTPGERIEITRGAEKMASKSGFSYWPYRTSFPDAPEQNALAALTGNVPTPQETALDAPEPEFVLGDADDIPF